MQYSRKPRGGRTRTVPVKGPRSAYAPLRCPRGAGEALSAPITAAALPAPAAEQWALMSEFSVPIRIPTNSEVGFHPLTLTAGLSSV